MKLYKFKILLVFILYFFSIANAFEEVENTPDLDLHDLEEKLRSYMLENNQNVINIWKDHRPDKPRSFVKYRKSLGIDPNYHTDHHIIAYSMIENFFLSFIDNLNDSVFLNKYINATINYIQNKQILLEEISYRQTDMLLVLKAIRTYVVWNPGNLAPGPLPENRKNDPGNKFDSEIYKETEMFEQNIAEYLKDAFDLISGKEDYNDKLKFFEFWSNIFDSYHYNIRWKISDDKYVVDYNKLRLYE
jgi:hypothetical protein